MNEPVLIFPKEVRHIERKIHEVLDIMGLPPKQETAVKKKIHYALWMYLDDPYRTVYDQEKVREVMYKCRRQHELSLIKKA
jgi:hypothetical protein